MFIIIVIFHINFLFSIGVGDAVIKQLHTDTGDTRDVGSIPGLGRSPGVENGNPLQYSCLKNPKDRGAWWATVPEVAKELDTTERLSNKVPGTILCREATTEWTHRCERGRGKYRAGAGKKNEGVFYPLSLLVY